MFENQNLIAKRSPHISPVQEGKETAAESEQLSALNPPNFQLLALPVDPNDDSAEDASANEGDTNPVLSANIPPDDQGTDAQENAVTTRRDFLVDGAAEAAGKTLPPPAFSLLSKPQSAISNVPSAPNAEAGAELQVAPIGALRPEKNRESEQEAARDHAENAIVEGRHTEEEQTNAVTEKRTSAISEARNVLQSGNLHETASKINGLGADTNGLLQKPFGMLNLNAVTGKSQSPAGETLQAEVKAQTEMAQSVQEAQADGFAQLSQRKTRKNAKPMGQLLKQTAMNEGGEEAELGSNAFTAKVQEQLAGANKGASVIPVVDLPGTLPQVPQVNPAKASLASTDALCMAEVSNQGAAALEQVDTATSESRDILAREHGQNSIFPDGESLETNLPQMGGMDVKEEIGAVSSHLEFLAQEFLGMEYEMLSDYQLDWLKRMGEQEDVLRENRSLHGDAEDQLEDDVEAHEVSKEGTEERAEDAGENVDLLDKRQDDLQRQYNSSGQQARELERKIASKQQELAGAGEQDAKLEHEIAQLTGQLQLLQQKQHGLQENAQQAGIQLDQTEVYGVQMMESLDQQLAFDPVYEEREAGMDRQDESLHAAEASFYEQLAAGPPAPPVPRSGGGGPGGQVAAPVSAPVGPSPEAIAAQEQAATLEAERAAAAWAAQQAAQARAAEQAAAQARAQAEAEALAAQQAAAALLAAENAAKVEAARIAAAQEAEAQRQALIARNVEIETVSITTTAETETVNLEAELEVTVSTLETDARSAIAAALARGEAKADAAIQKSESEASSAKSAGTSKANSIMANTREEAKSAEDAADRSAILRQGRSKAKKARSAGKSKANRILRAGKKAAKAALKAAEKEAARIAKEAGIAQDQAAVSTTLLSKEVTTTASSSLTRLTRIAQVELRENAIEPELNEFHAAETIPPIQPKTLVKDVATPPSKVETPQFKPRGRNLIREEKPVSPAIKPSHVSKPAIPASPAPNPAADVTTFNPTNHHDNIAFEPGLFQEAPAVQDTPPRPDVDLATFNAASNGGSINFEPPAPLDSGIPEELDIPTSLARPPRPPQEIPRLALDQEALGISVDNETANHFGHVVRDHPDNYNAEESRLPSNDLLLDMDDLNPGQIHNLVSDQSAMNSMQISYSDQFGLLQDIQNAEIPLEDKINGNLLMNGYDQSGGLTDEQSIEILAMSTVDIDPRDVMDFIRDDGPDGSLQNIENQVGQDTMTTMLAGMDAPVTEKIMAYRALYGENPEVEQVLRDTAHFDAFGRAQAVEEGLINDFWHPFTDEDYVGYMDIFDGLGSTEVDLMSAAYFRQNEGESMLTEMSETMDDTFMVYMDAVMTDDPNQVEAATVAVSLALGDTQNAMDALREIPVDQIPAVTESLREIMPQLGEGGDYSEAEFAEMLNEFIEDDLTEERAAALIAQNNDLADALGMSQALESYSYENVEHILEVRKAEIEEEFGGMCTSFELANMVAESNQSLTERYENRYIIPGEEYGANSLLENDILFNFGSSEGQANLLTGMLAGDLAKEDAARYYLAANGMGDTTILDQEAVLREQYDRALSDQNIINARELAADPANSNMSEEQFATLHQGMNNSGTDQNLAQVNMMNLERQFEADYGAFYKGNIGAVSFRDEADAAFDRGDMPRETFGATIEENPWAYSSLMYASGLASANGEMGNSNEGYSMLEALVVNNGTLSLTDEIFYGRDADLTGTQHLEDALTGMTQAEIEALNHQFNDEHGLSLTEYLFESDSPVTGRDLHTVQLLLQGVPEDRAAALAQIEQKYENEQSGWGPFFVPSESENLNMAANAAANTENSRWDLAEGIGDLPDDPAFYEELAELNGIRLDESIREFQEGVDTKTGIATTTTSLAVAAMLTVMSEGLLSGVLYGEIEKAIAISVGKGLAGSVTDRLFRGDAYTSADTSAYVGSVIADIVTPAVIPEVEVAPGMNWVGDKIDEFANLPEFFSHIPRALQNETLQEMIKGGINAAITEPTSGATSQFYDYNMYEQGNWEDTTYYEQLQQQLPNILFEFISPLISLGAEKFFNRNSDANSNLEGGANEDLDNANHAGGTSTSGSNGEDVSNVYSNTPLADNNLTHIEGTTNPIPDLEPANSGTLPEVESGGPTLNINQYQGEGGQASYVADRISLDVENAGRAYLDGGSAGASDSFMADQFGQAYELQMESLRRDYSFLPEEDMRNIAFQTAQFETWETYMDPNNGTGSYYYNNYEWEWKYYSNQNEDNNIPR